MNVSIKTATSTRTLWQSIRGGYVALAAGVALTLAVGGVLLDVTNSRPAREASPNDPFVINLRPERQSLDASPAEASSRPSAADIWASLVSSERAHYVFEEASSPAQAPSRPPAADIWASLVSSERAHFVFE